MKEVVLVSDSHRLRNFREALKNKYPEGDYFFHCGDSELSKEETAVGSGRTETAGCGLSLLDRYFYAGHSGK